ncbi:MAG: hypothetical protein IKJ77_06010 [Firmicutes bacterium]|nr:hypothetical protein [Bacillota bacterium]
MRKRLLGILLVLTLALASAVPAMAETEKISDDPNVQAAWEKYVDLKTALDGSDIEAVKTAYAAVEEANGALEWDDTELISEKDPEFMANLMEAAILVEVDKLYDAFVADKNTKTAKDFVDYYGMEDLADYRAGIAVFIPDVEAVYAEAQTMTPSENVIKVYDAYVGLANALEYWSVDESTREAVAAFDEVADIFNELSSEELADLALLMGEEDGPAAWNAVFSAVMDLNILISMDDVYQAYMNEPNAETAKAFAEYYEGVFPANPDDAMIDGELVRNFFMGIDDTYAEAKSLLAGGGQGDAVPEPETETEGEKAPETGDANTLLPLAALAAAGAAMIALRRKAA